VLGELERLAEKEPEAYAKIWENFGVILKEASTMISSAEMPCWHSPASGQRLLAVHGAA
jgi:hypothetical protein